MSGGTGVVLFGGAFNPPHLTHRRVLAAAMGALPVDRAIVLPAGRHPHKKGGADMAPDQARLELCQLAFGDLPGVSVRDLEQRRDGVAYSVDTVRELARELPGRPLFFLIGADNLCILDTWYDHHTLLELVTLVTWPRAGYPLDREELAHQDLSPTEIETLCSWVLDVAADGVSATAIRDALARGAKTPQLDPRVEERIRHLGLYAT